MRRTGARVARRSCVGLMSGGLYTVPIGSRLEPSLRVCRDLRLVRWGALASKGLELLCNVDEPQTAMAIGFARH